MSDTIRNDLRKRIRDAFGAPERDAGMPVPAPTTTLIITNATIIIGDNNRVEPQPEKALRPPRQCLRQRPLPVRGHSAHEPPGIHVVGQVVWHAGVL